MHRPTWTEYFMTMAFVAATRSNCSRRQIGCVIVKDNRIIGTGMNGTASGQTNCFEGGCERCASDVPSGQDLDRCFCIHSEVNAILYATCPIRDAQMYLTDLPCFTCSKSIVAAGIKQVFYQKEYPGNSKDYMTKCGVEVNKV